MATQDIGLRQLDLRQLTELEYILLGDLRDVLEEPASEENRRWLLAIVEALLETLPCEFALREQGGYMREIVLNSPELDSDVQCLQREHGSLCRDLAEFSEKLRLRRGFRKRAEVLKQQLAEWAAQLDAHNRSEEQLVQTAYQQDTGCGD
ncbi:MAG: hemerythrin domain-containing protein [Rubinisphaera brasiliensis]|uniref:Hemerythrin-like domain-containing protein n=1 Tax=Rubinisphaera brasiliensis (strain ATCC 49424 / DSM 5305 / JCM 21570 / IAM 15109 / NBRC 103401 / IFAM 1448) TaxID=756272 RepID=F0SPC4_RUBBR|nr:MULTISPECIES: hemerythrin domain-containing protein [Rubinisphaera]ADY62232.1 hypothetical protein Plabr_4661 [Rubinisphaera brasiliensis DSM 5305]MBR9800330.1 hypothetical protein [bacterium]